MFFVWPWISLARYSYWIYNIIRISIQCHSNPVLVPPHKPSDTVMDLYDCQNVYLKTSLYRWTNTDMVPVEYITLAHILWWMKCLFQFNTRINFKCDIVMWWIFDLFVFGIWLGHWNLLRIYRIPMDPVKRFVYLRFYIINSDSVQRSYWEFFNAERIHSFINAIVSERYQGVSK